MRLPRRLRVLVIIPARVDREASLTLGTIMDLNRYLRSAARWSAAGAGLAAAAYAGYAGITWYRYGHAAHLARPGDEDPLLDRFIPVYEVVERHQVNVAAPAEITLAAACDMDLQQSAIIRAIFKGRELILGSDPDEAQRPRGLLAQTLALGWGMLAEVPGREVVVGAATQPWKPDVVFRALPPEEFAAFHEPEYVKIVWTLRADPLGAAASMFRTETRAVTTDPIARAAFRRYWSCFSPGIVLIRRLSLGLVKAEAERRAR
jgi:hypothetical protein